MTAEPASPARTSESRLGHILGIPVSVGDRSQYEIDLNWVIEQTDRCRHIVTLNPEYVMAARRQPVFRMAIERADLILVDGAGVSVALTLQRRVRASRFTGSMLIEHFSKAASTGSHRMFLLGGQGNVAQKASEAMLHRWGAGAADYWSGGTEQPAHDAESLARIATADADLLLVAYGAPGQVLWIDRNLESLSKAGVRVAVGIGGALDVLAGELRAAPAIMQQTGLEWLFRLWQEPWRWKRQATLPLFAALVVDDLIRNRPKAK